MTHYTQAVQWQVQYNLMDYYALNIVEHVPLTYVHCGNLATQT